MRPTQLWLPLWEVNPLSSPLARDIRQAFARWEEDDVVWLIPGLDQFVRWQDLTSGRRDVAIPAKHFNRIAVYHVDRNGYLSAAGADHYSPSGRIDDALLDAWLTIGESRALLAGEPPDHIVIDELPVIQDGQFIRYVGPARVRLQWTEADRPVFVLPEPLTQLLPLGASLEQGAELEWMAAIAKASANSLARALRVATAYAGPYISKGIASVARASLMPLKVHEGEAGVIDATQRFVPNVRSFAQGINSPEWCDLGMRPVIIRRVWGVFGLFWALLLERLEASLPFSVYEDCKRLLSGTHKQSYCSREDDIKCFNNRRSRTQRRSRAHQKPKGAAQSSPTKPPSGR
jgi:hypothetical protein